MDFYYPNKINDFWRIMGLIFHHDKSYFCNKTTGGFNLKEIKEFLNVHGIALNDTGAEIRRLKDNASDKFLEIVKPVNLQALLELMPECHTIATTGEKAAGVIASLTASEPPRMGKSINCTYPGSKSLTVFRMPSTSRAYPMPLDKKAEYYAEMFRSIGIL